MPDPADFGKYQLVKPLAASGTVERFVAEALGAHGFQKRVVIKRLVPQLVADKVSNAMLIAEAKLGAYLVHPKIVQTIELGTVDGAKYVALEHVDGVDLRTLLREFAQRKRRLAPQLGAWIAHEVLDALDYAHHVAGEDGKPLGIIHGDLSPPSVLLSVRGDVKLVDFGVADAKAPEIAPERYGYASPEHVLEQPRDVRSDVFGVGVILAELVMGRRLFVAANETDTLLMVRDADLKRLDSFGAEIECGLSSIIRRALSRNANERWQTAAAFREAIGEWLFEHKHRMSARDVAVVVRELDPETPTVEPSRTTSIQISYQAPTDEPMITQARTTTLTPPSGTAVIGSGLIRRPTLVGIPPTAKGTGTGPMPKLPASQDAASRDETSPRTTPLRGMVALSRTPSTESATSTPIAKIAVSRTSTPQTGISTPRTSTPPAGIAMPRTSTPPAGTTVSRTATADSDEERDTLPIGMEPLRAPAPVPSRTATPRTMTTAGLGTPARGPSVDAPHAGMTPLERGIAETIGEAVEQLVIEDATMHPFDMSGPFRRPDIPRPTAEDVQRTPPPTPPEMAQITSPPDGSGDLSTTAPLRVLFRLMSSRATGLLSVAVGGIKKDLYLKNGQPQSMSSNVASELFGNYLVAKNILSDGELAMALATMPHYGGKLGDTLVGLQLLKPVDVVRHLTRQVRAKLIDVCTWSRGTFAWYANQENPLEAFPLGFDAFEVLGAGAAALPDGLVERWLTKQAAVQLQLANTRPVTLEQFALRGLVELGKLLDGNRTIGQVVEKLDRAERLTVARMVYLLEACELARAR